MPTHDEATERLAVVRSIVVTAVLACGMVGCGTRAPELTPEVARSALIELIRSGSSKDLEDFPLEKYLHSPVEKAFEPGWRWGWFHFEVQRNKYDYCSSRGRCDFMYEGTFELQGGRWVATPPQCTSIAMSRP
jgi:hypothetical protein